MALKKKTPRPTVPNILKYPKYQTGALDVANKIVGISLAPLKKTSLDPFPHAIGIGSIVRPGSNHTSPTVRIP